MEFLAEDPAHAVVALMLSSHGTNISSYSESFLRQTLDRRMAERRCASEVEYLKFLKQNRLEAKAFLFALRVTYSEFFRDPFTFGALEEFIIPQLLERASNNPAPIVRAWCAACASGQESWSLAMLLEDANRTRRTSIPYQIVASDVSEESLAHARKGVYAQDLVGNVRLRQLSRHFQAEGDAYKVRAALRKQVQFIHHDLLDESTPFPQANSTGAFNIILCRNVLFYFRHEVQRQLVGRLRRCLAPGGILVLGEAERLIAESAGFRDIAAPLCIFEAR